jgi:hypothetical protein
MVWEISMWQTNNLNRLPWMTSGVMSYRWSLTSFHPSDIAMNDWSSVMWIEALPPFISFDITMNDWICFIWMLQPYLFSFIWYIHECLESCHTDETIPFSPILHNHEWLESCHTYLKPALFSSIWHSNHEWQESCHMDENLAIFIHPTLLLQTRKKKGKIF